MTFTLAPAAKNIGTFKWIMAYEHAFEALEASEGLEVLFEALVMRMAP
jgi:hypothetical protein